MMMKISKRIIVMTIIVCVESSKKQNKTNDIFTLKLKSQFQKQFSPNIRTAAAMATTWHGQCQYQAFWSCKSSFHRIWTDFECNVSQIEPNNLHDSSKWKISVRYTNLWQYILNNRYHSQTMNATFTTS